MSRARPDQFAIGSQNKMARRRVSILGRFALIAVGAALTLSCQSAGNGAGVDPNTPEGQAKIAQFKRDYVFACSQDLADEYSPEEGPARYTMMGFYTKLCTCGTERGLAKFTDDDFRTITLRIDDRTVDRRMKAGIRECGDVLSKDLNAS